MKKFNLTPISLTLMSIALLGGCAATEQANKDYNVAKSEVETKYNESFVKSSAAAISENSLNKTINFGKTNKNWIDPIPLLKQDPKVKLPDFFSKKVSMTMPGTINAVEVLTEMQRSVNIKFSLSPDVYDTSNGMGSVVTATGGTSKSNKSSPLLISDFVYHGSLEEALNLLGAKTNLSWRWNGQEVEIYRYETKTYNISALAGSTNTSSNVDLKGDTSASAAKSDGKAPTSGTSSSLVSRSSTLTTWEEVKTFLIAQLSPNGSMAILESAGAVTIKDVPIVQKRIEKSINSLNTLLSKQIYLNIDMYAVTKSDGDDVGLDLNLAWQGSANSQFKFSSLNPSTTSAKSAFNVGILQGPWTGTNMIVKALSNIGKASVINQFSITTLNGQPTPVASNRKESYLASTKVTAATQTSGAITELIPAEISAGINLNVTPKIEPNGNILLEYAMNLSNIESITTYASPDGSASLQLPISNLKSVLQRATLRSGETLVLSGFKENVTKINKSGVGSPNNMILGGSQNATYSSQYLVITVTPYIANSNAYNK